MPSGTSTLCRQCDHRALDGRRYCSDHATTPDDETTARKHHDAKRADDSTRRLYKRKRWTIGTRLAVLRRDPLCCICGNHASKVADHYPIPARELVTMFGESAFYDASRCRGLCVACHDALPHTSTQ